MSFKRVLEIAGSIGIQNSWEGRSYVFRDLPNTDGFVGPAQWILGKMTKADGDIWKGRYGIVKDGKKYAYVFSGDKVAVAKWIIENFITEVRQPEERARETQYCSLRDRPSVHHQTYLFDPAAMISLATLGGLVGACILIVAIVKASFAFAA